MDNIHKVYTDSKSNNSLGEIEMKIAAMFANGSGGTVGRPDPQPVEDFVLVKIRSVPMCTDIKSPKGNVSRMQWASGMKPREKW